MKQAGTKKKQPGIKKQAWEGDLLVRFIPLEDLLPNPYQPATRQVVAPETAKAFALSIQEHGLIQTPVVRDARQGDGKYEIADGWLRRAGFDFLVQETGLEQYAKMPCVIRELTDQQMADMVLEANTIRKDLNPIELGKLYKQYLEDFKIPQVELARRHNCSQGEIANTIRLLELPVYIQDLIISQEISETHGRQLLRVNFNEEMQKKEVTDCLKRGSSVSELSNSIGQELYYNSYNMEPNEYPAVPFDVAGCETCPNRQKIGMPYSNNKKNWRCMDKKCYEEKKNKAIKERVAQLQAEVEAAQLAGPQKGKKKGKVGVIDTTSLGWRDYQELDSYKKIDDPEQCKTCSSRAVGLFHNARTGPICVNVKCFQQKEKAHQVKEAAESRKVEQGLTDKLKAVCSQELDQTVVLKTVAQHLLNHCRKDTIERFGRMYKLDDPLLYFAANTNGDILQKLAALVLQKERYEGIHGMFNKLMAELEGTQEELQKQIEDFKEKHCKTCQNGVGYCRTLMRVYYEGKCYMYSKKQEVDEKDKTTEKSSTDELAGKLPCETCAHGTTCDRSHFYADNQDGYICDEKEELVEAQP